MSKPLILTGQEPNKQNSDHFFLNGEKMMCKTCPSTEMIDCFSASNPMATVQGGSRDSLSEDCSGREGDRRSFSISLSWGELWRFLIFFLAQRGFWIGRGDQMRGRETTIYDWLILTVNGLFKLLFFLVGEKIYSFFNFFFSFSQPILV